MKRPYLNELFDSRSLSFKFFNKGKNINFLLLPIILHWSNIDQ